MRLPPHLDFFLLNFYTQTDDMTLRSPLSTVIPGIKVGGKEGCGWMANLQLPQAFTTLLDLLCTHNLVTALQRAMTVMLQAEPF
jgi:hypothetical protein